jgi:hypothetical protein
MTQGGGLLQLVAQGRQDVFLTGNPQVTWFKMVYRRYTNFSLESQFIPFDNQPDFGRKVTCLLPRKGDLLGALWLEIQLPALKDSVTGLPLSYTNSTAHALIQEVSLEIGDQEIDKQTGEWMEIYSNYTVDSDKKDAWGAMIGKTTGASRGNANSTVVNQAPGSAASASPRATARGSGVGFCCRGSADQTCLNQRRLRLDFTRQRQPWRRNQQS